MSKTDPHQELMEAQYAYDVADEQIHYWLRHFQLNPLQMEAAATLRAVLTQQAANTQRLHQAHLAFHRWAIQQHEERENEQARASAGFLQCGVPEDGSGAGSL